MRTGRLSALGRLASGDSADAACGGSATEVPLQAVATTSATATPAPLRLTKADVDSFQRAKAAIGAGISALLGAAQLPAASLRQLWLAGAFGSALDLENARAIGLLPAIPDEHCHFSSHAALNGCERSLVNQDATTQLEQLRRRARLVNLAHYPDFESAFMEHLYLRPRADTEAAPT